MSRGELLQWRIIIVLLLTAQIRNRKTFETYLELANARFFPFLQDNANKYCAVGMSERERRMRWWIAACRLNSLNVMRHTGTCSVHFEGAPGRTKFDPAPRYLHYHNIFSENLRKVDVRKQRKEVKETLHRRRRTRWCLPPENKQDVKPEPVCIVQSDLSEQGSGIVSLSVTNLAEKPTLLVSDFDGKFTSFCRSPREIKIQNFFTTLIRNTDSPHL